MTGSVIGFYGVDEPELFAIERESMDRSGLVIAALDRTLPDHGVVIDLGAGDGFTAHRLTTADRMVIGMEPAMERSDEAGATPWVKGANPDLPLANARCAGVYSTWAYFFPDYHDIGPALTELDRVVVPDGPIVIVDNAGEDQFCAMAEGNIAIDPKRWEALGFAVEIVETAFEFESIGDAKRLLTRFFGPDTEPILRIEHRVTVATKLASPANTFSNDH